MVKLKEEGEKAGLKLSIQKKTKIMVSSPITLWQIDGGKVETVADFIFLNSRITVDDDCSHESKRRLLLGRKAITDLDSVLKSRDSLRGESPRFPASTVLERNPAARHPPAPAGYSEPALVTP